MALESGAEPKLDFGGGGHNCAFCVKSFLTLLFAIENITVLGGGVQLCKNPKF